MQILTGHNHVNPVTPRNLARSASDPSSESEAPPHDLVVTSDPECDIKCKLNALPVHLKNMGNWRDVTLSEALIEIPQGILELSNLRASHPVAGGVAQGGIVALAMVRAVEGLKGNSVEQKMEGTASLVLAVAGTVSLFPGSLAASTAGALMMGQGGIELALGVRELHEEFYLKDKPCWQEVVTGSLDVIKGGSAFLPLLSPNLNTISSVIALGALVAKTAMESTFVHDPGQKLA